MPALARCNGVVLVEDGEVVRVVDQGGGWLGTAVFVSVLVAALLGAAGIAIATRALATGAGMLAGSAAIGAIAVVLVRSRRRRRATPDGGDLLVAFDFGTHRLLGPGGETIAPLDQVRIARTWQAGSSSKALAVVSGSAKIVIARGTPFGDEVDRVEQALVARGVARG
jgi:hypothetical protein